MQAILESFGDRFWDALRHALFRRLGLAPQAPDVDTALIRTLFTALRGKQGPFEAVMFDLYGGLARLDKACKGPRSALYSSPPFEALMAAWMTTKPDPSARLDARYFAGDEPVTLLYDDIEALWAPIAERDDWSRFAAKLTEIDEVRLAYGFAG